MNDHVEMQNSNNNNEQSTGENKLLSSHESFSNRQLTKKATTMNKSNIEPVPNREEKANLFSRIFMLWFIPILILSAREIKSSRGKEEFVAQLGKIAVRDDPELLYPAFKEYWKEEQENKTREPKLTRVMIKIITYRTLIIGGILTVCQMCAVTGVPFVMKNLLLELSGATTSMTTAEKWLSVTGIILLPFIGAMCQAQVLFLAKRASVRLYSVFTQAIFEKSLSLSCAARNKSSTGQIVNLMASDASTALERAVMLMFPLVLAPIQIGILLYLTYDQIGISAVTGIVILVLSLPINIFIFVFLTIIYRRIVTNTDKRVNLVNEAIQAIRVIKMYAWERPFMKQIIDIRNEELKVLRIHAYLYSVGLSAIFLQLPFLIQYGSFTTYYLLDNPFYPWIIFTAIQLFNIVQQSLNQFPQALSQLSQTTVACRRIQDFLELPELSMSPDDVQILDDTNQANCEVEIGEIRLQNASFAWEEVKIPEKPDGKNKKNKKAKVQETQDSLEGTKHTESLFDLSLHIRRGEKIAVVGSVGSGKSSLLAAFTGEMVKTQGRQLIRGSVALHTQKPFIITGTIRENITFGRSYDPELYQSVIKACCLEDDFKQLDKGDMCVVGERGINLSGGQKARVGLARSVYADRSIVMLDDPLSAVDAHVGAHILNECIHGQLLKGKTLIFVTNKLDKLREFDYVCLLSEGKVVKYGPPDQVSVEDILKIENEENQIRESSSRHRSSKEQTVDEPGTAKQGEDDDETGNEIYKEEEEETGTLKFRVLKFYVKSGGVFMFPAGYMLYMLYLFTPVFSQYILTFWTDDTVTCSQSSTPCDVDAHKWWVIYTSIFLGGFVICLIAGVLIANARVAGSRYMHNRLLEVTMQASIPYFFDTTPVGRILNRFSKDIAIVDILLSQMVMFVVICLGLVCAAFVGMILGTGFYFAVALLPIVFMYVFLYHYARKSAVVLQRVEAGSRAPIYSGFAEVLNGLQTIRAFKVEDRFFSIMRSNLSSNVMAYILVRVALPACLTVGISLIGMVVSASVSCFIVGSNLIDSGLAGLGLSASVSISNAMNYAVFIGTEVEIMMNSVERIQFYIDNMEPEEVHLDTIVDKPGAPVAPRERTVIPEGWPSRGEVVISNLVLGYRDGPDVIHGISLTINPAEKIGIVGRTGSGKSSLLLGLLFIIRPRSGKIVIDGIDLSSITLEELRSHVGIIPQDPVCFRGTLRFNLDPFGQHSDEELLEVLKTCNLSSFNLTHDILDGGENVSVGQRQMICFGRAVLRKSRLLMLDEATASVDHETDNALQEMIRKVFADRTVITIAHRLNTILDSDRILVMQDGNIAEFDSPANLLAKQGGIFRSMNAAENEK